MRRAGLDRTLIMVVLALITFGVLMVYSAGQTDVPTAARGAWIRQIVWIGLATIAAAVAFRINSRLLEWGAPGIYALGLLLLLLTLLVGTGAGSAASSKSWLQIGGVRIGQPVELAKLATVLLLARYLSSLREPPDSLRRLVVPGMIAAVPFLLVLIGFFLAYAVVMGGLPGWIRPTLMTFCGVASNFAGVPLALAFVFTLGNLGVLTALLRSTFGFDLSANGFKLSDKLGLELVYLYFQIPLMILIITPALDGLKREWREAAEILGISEATVAWRMHEVRRILASEK